MLRRAAWCCEGYAVVLTAQSGDSPLPEPRLNPPCYSCYYYYYAVRRTPKGSHLLSFFIDVAVEAE